MKKYITWNLGKETYLETVWYSQSLPVTDQFNEMLGQEEHMGSKITAFILTIPDSKCQKGKT